MYLLQAQAIPAASRNPLVLFQRGFERGFERMRDGYAGLLASAGASPRHLRAGSSCWCASRLSCCCPWLGQDFFPNSTPASSAARARQDRHAHRGDRAPLRPGGAIHPPPDSQGPGLASILDNIGLPYSSINTIYSNSGAIGSADADILVSLNENHRPTEEYVRALRANAAAGVSRHGVLLPARRHRHPDSELRVARADRRAGGGHERGRQPRLGGPYAGPVAPRPRARRPAHPAAVRPAQAAHYHRPHQGRAERITRSTTWPSSLLVALSGSFQTQPTFWLNPENGVNYNVVTQAPQYRVQSLQDLRNMPLTSQRAGQSRRFSTT